jgi:hypothetical protein
MEKNINEVNLYGFEQGKVDSGKVVTGGDGGNWGGSMERALQVASIVKACGGPNPSSQKRSRVKTASGNVSDHYQGNTSAYAIDIPAKGSGGDNLLKCIMSKFNSGAQAGYKGGKWLDVNVDGYRYQFGWRVKNHYDHIHVGVKKGGGGSTKNIPLDDTTSTSTSTETETPSTETGTSQGFDRESLRKSLPSSVNPDFEKIFTSQLKQEMKESTNRLNEEINRIKKLM